MWIMPIWGVELPAGIYLVKGNNETPEQYLKYFQI